MILFITVASHFQYTLNNDTMKQSKIEVAITRHTMADSFFENVAKTNLSLITGVSPMLSIPYTAIDAAYQYYTYKNAW